MPAEHAAADVVLLVPALEGGSAPEPDTATGRAPPGAAATHPLAVLAGEAAAAVSFEREPLPPAPWESRLMARLGLVPATARASGASPVPGAEIPAARLLVEADLRFPPGGTAPAPAAGGTLARSAPVVMADPVSLVPGRDEATLLPPESLALSEAEAREFVAAAAPLLEADALALERGSSGRWYLRGLDAGALAAPPTHFVAHRGAGAWLPAGDGARRWRRLTSELEMLWHAHPRNAERRTRGLAPLNGIWFWGGAPPPAPPPAPPSLTLVASDPLALALGRHAGVATRAPESLDALLAEGASGTLVIVDLAAQAAWLADDAGGLAAAVDAIAARWLQPALRALREGRAASLVVESGDAHRSRALAAPPRGWLGRLFGARSRRGAGTAGAGR